MKKILILLLSAGMLFSYAFAQSGEGKSEADVPSAVKAKRTKEEIKTDLLKNIEKKENGDVILNMPKIGKKHRESAKGISGSLLYLMLFVDDDFDGEKMAKKMKPGESKYVSDTMKNLSAYFATKNFSLRKTGFSMNTAGISIDTGLPIFAWFMNPDFEKRFEKRTKQREGVTDMKEWIKDLRKNEVDLKKGTTWTTALIIGYNKTTKECLVYSDGARVWMTEGEIKSIGAEFYTLRY